MVKKFFWFFGKNKYARARAARARTHTRTRARVKKVCRKLDLSSSISYWTRILNIGQKKSCPPGCPQVHLSSCPPTDRIHPSYWGHARRACPKNSLNTNMLPSYKKYLFIKRTLLVSERAMGLDLQMILKFHQLFYVSLDV